ncbi:hypothetical protein BH10PSE10_BH10PSE10_24420 [soil metagenome]
MSNHLSELFVDVRGRMILLAILAVTLGTATAAWPQQPQPQLQVAPSQQAAPPVAAPPAAPERSNPGLVEELGKLLKDSASGLGSALPSPGQALDGLNSSAKDATDSLKRMAPLAGQTVATGRALCPAAANGAPDCKLGADQLCKAKGYAEGRSVDIESSQKCSAKAYFAGNGACRTENFVTRAVCQ